MALSFFIVLMRYLEMVLFMSDEGFPLLFTDLANENSIRKFMDIGIVLLYYFRLKLFV
jgi:hypothetical protein